MFFNIFNWVNNMDKFIKIFKVKNRIMLFFIVLFIVGIIAGSLFTTFLSISDKEIVINYMNEYFNNLDNINYLETLKSSISSNLLYTLVIWVLGISIIGIPLIFVIFISIAFILGFSISAIVLNFGFNGILISLAYIFPFEIINAFIFAFLSMYAFVFSINLIRNLFKSCNIDMKLLFSKYKNILFVSLIIILLSTLLGNFLTPIIIKSILNLSI